jgi:hypothetical protein
MVRRLFLKGMNYFDERFGEHWADLELCWQLRSAGKSILVLPAVRVAVGPSPEPPHDPVYSADAAIGAAAYLGKHYGAVAGLKFRLAAILNALGRTVSFRDPGFNFKVLTALVSGQKIDGK